MKEDIQRASVIEKDAGGRDGGRCGRGNPYREKLIYLFPALWCQRISFLIHFPFLSATVLLRAPSLHQLPRLLFTLIKSIYKCHYEESCSSDWSPRLMGVHLESSQVLINIGQHCMDYCKWHPPWSLHPDQQVHSYCFSLFCCSPKLWLKQSVKWRLFSCQPSTVFAEHVPDTSAPVISLSSNPGETRIQVLPTRTWHEGGDKKKCSNTSIGSTGWRLSA